MSEGTLPASNCSLTDFTLLCSHIGKNLCPACPPILIAFSIALSSLDVILGDHLVVKYSLLVSN